MDRNLDRATVDSFGDEWARFDQSGMTEAEAESIFADYFSVFPWERLPPDPVGFDMGCGSGRWAQRVAPRVGYLHCIDPSAAIEVARRMLANCSNVGFHRASVGDAPLPPGSQDFGYSLGVLHHVPDTADALKSCADLLKQGAPFLVYLYYAFDNRPIAFRIAWRCSDLLRRLICKLPGAAKHLVTDALAAIVYLPLVLVSRGLARVGMDVSGIPLSYYRNRSWYTMRTDSRDRFGTPLERRFTREQIRSMMESAGLREVRFSEREPYWCAVGIRE